ncbi:hypothetical protein BDM02DRAFT_3107056 [Thelephora ganbajun]|uniref:Uncharacterized protein n=1 Tax=Thelephora ganbajun TaxID=370292 RepID=A0ACB6ZWY0_THEGA|nr:hypothetical protein BDM02DRAFT_3107056 [Thelephora ganbajun]
MPSLARSRLVRDVLLVFLGAVSMHFVTTLFHPFDDLNPTWTLQSYHHEEIVIDPPPYGEHDNNKKHDNDNPVLDHDNRKGDKPPSPLRTAVTPVDVLTTIPETELVHHAPGWTIFKNLYMSNGTFYVVSDKPRSEFPELLYILSVAIPALNTPENIQARLPTEQQMDFIGTKNALRRWGPVRPGEKNRIWSITGSTWFFNDPLQFLDHYYHFVAELLFGTWAFWTGSFNATIDTKTWTSSAPPIDRAIFANNPPEGIRDKPGFNSYFLRSAFSSLTVESERDWADRIFTTINGDRAYYLDTVLIADRSAAFKGKLCGATSHRIAAEAYEPLWDDGRLQKEWWEPVRREVLRFAGVEERTMDLGIEIERAWEEEKEKAVKALGGNQDALSVQIPIAKEKTVVTYISRQAARRHLIREDHQLLVASLQEMTARKGYELIIIEAEKLSKDEQLGIMSRTTVLVGVHGNGLSHVLWLTPSRYLTVVEIFFPGGFTHDYEWTTRAMRGRHFAIWNDTYHTYPDTPGVAYPEGFQGTSIPVYGPMVAKVIEDRLDGKLP